MIVPERGVLAVSLKDRVWDAKRGQRAARALSMALGAACDPGAHWGREARFELRPRLTAEWGAAALPARDGAASGDSWLARLLDNRRLLALISDGMGRGEGAARESARAVRLLERFMLAGIDGVGAAEAVNALLQNRGAEDMFATMDLLELNLDTGDAAFLKLGACATMIVRDGEVSWVQGGCLPLGILERVEPGRFRARLEPGDALMMASDGVMDALDEDRLTALLNSGLPPKTIARQTLDAAREALGEGRRDDMTVICVRIGSG